ncbi:hypothetical protein Tco_0424148 [Tanacetum coccineum]
MIKCEVEWLKAIKVEMKEYMIRKVKGLDVDALFISQIQAETQLSKSKPWLDTEPANRPLYSFSVYVSLHSATLIELSVMEAMKFGVPIIAMPMQLDQPVNARLVVDLGLGKKLKKSGRYQIRYWCKDESKKMQKYILKQQFESFSVSNSEGLHKGYDRFQSLLSQLEIHGAGVSTEDANQKVS